MRQHQKAIDTELQNAVQMGTRPYHPGLGRLLAVDPVEGGTPNDYGYVTDPSNSFDLNGMWGGFPNPIKAVKKVAKGCWGHRSFAGRDVEASPVRQVAVVALEYLDGRVSFGGGTEGQALVADYSGLIRDVKRFQEAAFSGTGLDGTLPPGATEEELASAEEDLGFGLPGELKALYRFCGGGLPLGVHYWLPIAELGEQTRDVSDYLEDHYESLEPLPPLEEGPKGHRFVCIHRYPRTIVVEADEGSRVWEYEVHSPDSPFLLAAGSLGEYWSILAALAESGWYRARDRVGVSVVEPYIGLVDEARHDNPAYVADLERLGLGQRDFYL